MRTSAQILVALAVATSFSAVASEARNEMLPSLLLAAVACAALPDLLESWISRGRKHDVALVLDPDNPDMSQLRDGIEAAAGLSRRLGRATVMRIGKLPQGCRAAPDEVALASSPCELVYRRAKSDREPTRVKLAGIRPSAMPPIALKGEEDALLALRSPDDPHASQPVICSTYSAFAITHSFIATPTLLALLFSLCFSWEITLTAFGIGMLHMALDSLGAVRPSLFPRDPLKAHLWHTGQTGNANASCAEPSVGLGLFDSGAATPNLIFSVASIAIIMVNLVRNTPYLTWIWKVPS